MKVVSVTYDEDLNVVFVCYDHPTLLYPAITCNEDGTYTVFYPARVSLQRAKEMIKHELRHIELRHFETERSVHEVEWEVRYGRTKMGPQTTTMDSAETV